ncbi:TetR/AcrR family transcriptional regulator [Microterricola pindariensis]|uniref:HTH tetR-type domain-containing protein n=1 Tax=Microterricola pindariensis TaxID=478010 RepID=A0ABX5B0Z4_9MICO|nr:TetR/AcrR family transcriptional regulator [Microterricola pindariensis]PPL20420.1 hypothetical protein GY24_01225 [Microterricola pindariensis]
MPKISKPTVAEHRSAQRAALLSAAEALLLEGGVAGVNPRTVGERAGLARSSFYDYFPSKDDLLAAVAMRAFDEWGAEIDEALRGTEPGIDRLTAYVAATMRMTADGRHAIAAELRGEELSPSKQEDIKALHDALLEPVRTVLEDLGVPDAAAQAYLVQGLLNTGVQLVTHGMSADDVTAKVMALLTRGLLV